jgi:hypothetical protein
MAGLDQSCCAVLRRAIVTGAPPRFRLHRPFQLDEGPLGHSHLKCAPRRPFGFPGFHRRSNDRRSLSRSRRADPPGPPNLGSWRRVRPVAPAPGSQLPGREQAPFCNHPWADAAWGLSSGACSTRGRALDRSRSTCRCEIATQSDQATRQSPAPSPLAASQQHTL